MHRIRPVAALAATLLAVAVLAVPASATSNDPPPPGDVCEIPQSHEEAKYERDVYEAQVQLSKHTRTREKTRPWFTNDWSGWSAWTDPAPWGDGFVDAEWVPADAVPAPTWVDHGSGEETIGSPDFVVRKWQRERAQLPNGETRDEFVETEKTGWLTSPPDGDGWVETKRRTVDDPPIEFPCPTATATPGDCDAPGVITPSESENYTSTIDGDTVTFEATPPAVFGPEVVTEFSFPEIAQTPAIDCVEKPDPETREDVSEKPDCDADKITTTTRYFETPYEWDPETETYVLGDEVEVGEPLIETRPATDDDCPPPPEVCPHDETLTVDDPDCEEPTPPTTTPPPTTPPTSTPPVDDPPAQVSENPPAESLPVTGSPVWPLLRLAGLLGGTGYAAVRFVRRFS